MMMSNNMENVAPHVIKNVSRQVGMTWSKTSYLEVAKVVYFWHPFKRGPFCKFGKSFEFVCMGIFRCTAWCRKRWKGSALRLETFHQSDHNKPFFISIYST